MGHETEQCPTMDYGGCGGGGRGGVGRAEVLMFFWLCVCLGWNGSRIQVLRPTVTQSTASLFLDSATSENHGSDTYISVVFFSLVESGLMI